MPRANASKSSGLSTQEAQHAKLTFTAGERQSCFSNSDNPTFQVTILLNLLPFIKVALTTLSNSPTSVLIFSPIQNNSPLQQELAVSLLSLIFTPSDPPSPCQSFQIPINHVQNQGLMLRRMYNS